MAISNQALTTATTLQAHAKNLQDLQQQHEGVARQLKEELAARQAELQV